MNRHWRRCPSSGTHCGTSREGNVLEALTISTPGKAIKKLHLGSLQLFRAEQEIMDINCNSRGLD